MSGHSKWKNIQHRKGAQDAKRGKIFTKIAKEITVAAKIGGADPNSNPRLRLALGKARAVNMPRDNIDRAIKKGVGDTEGIIYTEKTYEGYGPGGIALIVECLTDNINRTVSEVRHAFTRAGGNLGTDGSVSYMFNKKGIIVYEKESVKSFDELFELALNNNADDVKEEGEVYEIICEPNDFNQLKDALDTLNLEPLAAELTMIPDNVIEVNEEKSKSIKKLIDILEDNDDVQNVYHNADLVEGED